MIRQNFLRLVNLHNSYLDNAERLKDVNIQASRVYVECAADISWLLRDFDYEKSEKLIKRENGYLYEIES